MDALDALLAAKAQSQQPSGDALDAVLAARAQGRQASQLSASTLPAAATRPEFSLFGQQITTPPDESGFNLPAAVIGAGRQLDNINQGIRQAKLSVFGPAYQALANLGIPGMDQAAQDTIDEQLKQQSNQADNAKRYAQLQDVHPGSTLLGGTAPLLPLNLPMQGVAALADYGSPQERVTRAGLTYGLGKGVQALGGKATADYQASAADAATRAAQNAEREATLRAAQQQGYVVPPSTVNPTAFNRTLEGLGGKAGVQQQASNINNDVTQRIVRQALGLPDNAPITSKAAQQVRNQAYQQGYAPVAAAGQLPVSPEFNAALDAITAKSANAAQSFPGAANTDVAAMVDSFRPPNGAFDAKHAIDASQQLRTDARNLFMTPGGSQMAQAKLAVSREIENELERQLAAKGEDGAKMLADFRAARQKMAIAHDVEDAVREGSGTVENSVFGRKVQNGDIPPSSPLAVAGNFANVFPKANQRSGVVGSANVSKVEGGMGLLAALAGHASLGPYGLAAGALPFIVPPTARGMVLSAPYQRAMTQMTAKPQGLLASKALDNEVAPWLAGLLGYQAANP